jgi:lysophospholipase L1-like esterase
VIDDAPPDRLSLGTAIAAVICAAVISGILMTILDSPTASDRGGAATAMPERTAVKGDRARTAANAQQSVPLQPPASGTAQVIGAFTSAGPATTAPTTAPDPPPTLQLGDEGNDQAARPSETPLLIEPRTVQVSTRAQANSSRPRPAPDLREQRGLVILQIGDSHTAADFFSGDLRQRLQQRYGSGGAGYITAGRPHIGVRSSALKVAASSGWTYKAIQKSDNPSEFWLSGFNALASKADETLSFTAETPITFDAIEIEALRQPGGGAVDVSIDGAVEASLNLDSKTVQPFVVRLTPPTDSVSKDRVRHIEIRTTNDKTVSIASIAVYNRKSGVSYNSVGYPGATIDLLNRFDQKLFADGLRRLNPQIVVLAFGTNEASRGSLDPERFRQAYEKALDKITSVLPDAKIVLIGPPDGAERASHCARPPLEAACHPIARAADAAADQPPSNASAAVVAPLESVARAAKKEKDKDSACEWHTLPKLEAVRNVERTIAERRGLTYWNWASIMPQKCGSHAWANALPPLMAPDHVHFTVAGYNRGAEQFLNVLIPVIDRLQVWPNIAYK